MTCLRANHIGTQSVFTQISSPDDPSNQTDVISRYLMCSKKRPFRARATAANEELPRHTGSNPLIAFRDSALAGELVVETERKNLYASSNK